MQFDDINLCMNMACHVVALGSLTFEKLALPCNDVIVLEG